MVSVSAKSDGQFSVSVSLSSGLIQRGGLDCTLSLKVDPIWVSFYFDVRHPTFIKVLINFLLFFSDSHHQQQPHQQQLRYHHPNHPTGSGFRRWVNFISFSNSFYLVGKNLLQNSLINPIRTRGAESAPPGIDHLFYLEKCRYELQTSWQFQLWSHWIPSKVFSWLFSNTF